jgi:alpha-amylase/alpha-mannosidase (GH57 family)
MGSDTPVKVVLCWHMHQPDYRDHLRDEFLLPWTYLHGIRDYVDMAAHIESVPGARAVINFSPILLEQLQIYEQQIGGYLKHGRTIRDPLLAALDSAVFPPDSRQRISMVEACLRSNQQHQIDRFFPYARLVEIARVMIHELENGSYISDQYLADLVTWYHLAWLGETVRRENEHVSNMIEQGGEFTLYQRRLLLEVIYELLSGLQPRYTELANSGKIELSMSPYTHPMTPLLQRYQSARETMPDIKLPVLAAYPGGQQRSEWHVRYGLEIFSAYFGRKPAGCWPSEGGISMETVNLLEQSGFRWIATGEKVLRNSIAATPGHHDNCAIYRCYATKDSGLRLFARDDTLSDLIGFTYASWHADDAVNDLIHRIEDIAGKCNDRENTVISIIMDGENAWEYYPENGYYFLSTLYQRLVAHPDIQLTTYQEIIDSQPEKLAGIVPGSWVFGTFSTWIGDADKNRAWDILGDVKRVYDETINTIAPEKHPDIVKQLAACEGSDWFWWFGDYNPAATVSDFELMFRTHIKNLYHMLEREPPAYLSHIIARGSGSPELGGVIRPGGDYNI